VEHTDEETLVQIALGESPSSPDDDHVRTCSHCARELDALRHVVLTMKAQPPDEDAILTPPDDLWDSISRELRLAPEPAQLESAVSPSTVEQPADRGGDGPRPHTPVRTGRRGPRRLGRLSVALAACAALLGAAAGSTITWWITRDNANVSVADGRRLDSLQANSAGYARLSGSSGHRTLTITVEGLPRTSGYFEVWLMDRTHSKLVSMGVLGPDGRASLPVPSNIDLREYSVVDVSVQPYNGKPDHSGDSVVRGPYAG